MTWEDEDISPWSSLVTLICSKCKEVSHPGGGCLENHPHYSCGGTWLWQNPEMPTEPSCSCHPFSGTNIDCQKHGADAVNKVIEAITGCDFCSHCYGGEFYTGNNCSCRCHRE